MTLASSSTTLAESLEQFTVRARAFLESAASRRTNRADHWGSGSDAVGLFETSAESVDDPLVAAARAWQRLKNDAGFGWITGPTELGGAGLSALYELQFAQLENEFVVPDPTPLTLGLHMIRPTVAAWAAPGTRERVSRALTSAEVLGCQLFSETEAGSDLANVRTSARRDGDDWVISGQKVWTSNAHLAQVGLLLCRTGSETARHHNLTMFVVDMSSPGVTVRPIRQMSGASSFNEVTLDDVRIPDVHRLGDVDEGWKVAITTLTSERSAIGGGSASNAIDLHLLLELARRYGEDDAVTRDVVTRAYISTRLVEMFSARCTEESFKGEIHPAMFSMAKLLLTSSLRQVSIAVDHVLAQRAIADTGEWGTYAWRLIGLELSAYSVGGGSDEIQRNAVAERYLHLPR